MMFDFAMFNSAGAPQEAPAFDPEGISPVVAIATSRDLVELQEWLANLDEHAYGRVFIEAAAEPEAPALTAPDHVGVTWLRQSESPGVALSVAVDAWLAEWLWVDGTKSRSLEIFTAHHAGLALAGYLQRFDCQLEKRWPGCSRDACPKLGPAE